MNRAVTYVLAAVLAVGSTQDVPNETCDVLKAVECFTNMPSFTKPHTITGRPLVEIEQPCLKQIEETKLLTTCLDKNLIGCTTMYNDANILISESGDFCQHVKGCANFSTKYLDSLKCVTRMFVEITAGPGLDSSTEHCRNFSTCLNDSASHCDGLVLLLQDQWNIFEATCAIASVDKPFNLIMDTVKTPEPMACPQLADVVMGISDCHNTFKDEVALNEKIDIATYCTNVLDFHMCLNKTVVCSTSNYGTIIIDSMYNYVKAISPMCSPGQIDLVCDTGKMEFCFSNIDANMWKVEKYIVEGVLANGTTDHKKLIDQAKQMTGIAKDLVGMCSTFQSSVNSMNTCTQQYLAGCPSGFMTTFQANANFLESLCADMNDSACTDFNVVSASLVKCSDDARLQIAEYANESTDNQTADNQIFRTSFCRVFDNLIACMKANLRTCNISDENENFLALYEMLAEDLEPICTDEDFIQLADVSLSDSMENFLDCRDLPDMSYDLGKCHSSYLHALTQYPTTTEDICVALISWEICTQEVVEGCDQLSTDMRELTNIARNALDICPKPSTVSPTDPPPSPIPPKTNPTDGSPSTTQSPNTTVTNRTGVCMPNIITLLAVLIVLMVSL